MELQTFKDYTVDYRMKQFRRCEGGWENHGMIEFIEFDSEKGDGILCEMIRSGVLDYSKYKL
jgi:hypothetical protein